MRTRVVLVVCYIFFPSIKPSSIHHSPITPSSQQHHHHHFITALFVYPLVLSLHLLVIEVPIQLLLPLKPRLHWQLQRFSSRSHHPHQKAPEVCCSPAITLPIDYLGCPTC